MIILSKHDKSAVRHPVPDRFAAMERGIVERCRVEGLKCVTVPPLYHLAESSKLWKKLAEYTEWAVVLCWLHPRPAHWLLDRHQIGVDESRILNLAVLPDAAAAVAAATHLLQGALPTPSGSLSTTVQRTTQRRGTAVVATARKSLRAPTRPRWYPVIDGSRCIRCQHCLQFCLFGVYELDADATVRVQNPDQCKPGCPACARICPQSAIMFPLYEKDAAIAGAPGKWVTLDDAARKMFSARTQRPAFDDLDSLVDQLDQAMQRRG